MAAVHDPEVRSEVRFCFLGPFEVTRDGELLNLGGPKQRAVLVALLLEKGRTLSADRLIDLVWGEAVPASASASLQAYISNLRRVLEPDRGRRQPSRMLVTRSGGYALEIPDDSVDARRFERLVGHARGLLAEGDDVAARTVLEEALALWRGHALEEFGSAAFADFEAQRLAELRVLGAEDLLEARLRTGGHESVIGELEGLVATNPFRERLWGLLMLALYRSGRQADALQTFQRAQTILVEEFGIDPGPDLQRLQTDILNHAPSLDPSARARSPLSLREDRPLVGRDREVTLLERSLDEAEAGLGRTLLIFGEPGIGKTRLCEKLADLAHDRGFEVGWGRCAEGGAAPPYWPWTQLLREIDPVLADLIPDGEQSDPTVSRLGVCDSIARAIIRGSDSSPLLLILDDLQWADAASLELLRHTASLGRLSPLCLAATYRDIELRDEHPLVATLGNLAREAAVERLSLTGFEAGDVASFLTAVCGEEPHERVVTSVCDRTGGNPFFLTEIVRLLDQDVSAPESVLADVPLGVRDVIRRRLATLPAEARELLSLASVVGRDIELRLLEHLAGVDAEQLFVLIEPAFAAGLLTTEQFSACRFRHDLVREAIYRDLPEVQRIRLHGRVARGLLELHGEDTPADSAIAHHAWESAALLGGRAAARHIRRAALRATWQLAYEEAADWFSRALVLLGALPTGPEVLPEQLQCASGLTVLRTISFGYAHSLTGEALETTRELATAAHARPELLLSLWGLGTYHMLRAEFGEARRVAGDALGLADEAGEPAFRGSAHLTEGAVFLHEGRLREAREHLERAVEVLEDTEVLVEPASEFFVGGGTPARMRLSARCHLALAYTLEGRYEQGRSIVQEALGEVSRDTAPVYHLAFTHYFNAWIGAAARDVEGVLEHAGACGSLSSQHGFRLFAAGSRIMMEWARAHQDRPWHMEHDIAEAFRELDETHTRVGHAFLLMLLAEAQLRSGRISEAAATAGRAAEASEATGDRMFDPRLRELEELVKRPT